MDFPEVGLSLLVMAGLDPPAGPKPLRRGEGPAIHVFARGYTQDVDARDTRRHDTSNNSS